MRDVWIERINLTLLLGALGLGITGVMQLSYSDDESETLKFCTLGVPYEYEYTYRLVGMRNYPGFLASKMWLNASYYGRSAEVFIATTDSYFKDALSEVYRNGYNLSTPASPKEDKDIRLMIARDAKGCDAAKRRLYFTERLKDCLAYIGAASLMLFAVYAFGKYKDRG